MKKIRYIMMVVIALGCLLTSCSGDDEEITFDQTAAEGIVGEYTGEWIQALEGDTTRGEGILTFSKIEGDYFTQVTAVCSALKINLTSPANVSHTNADNYAFVNNNSTGNGFEAAFFGRVYSESKANIRYSKSVKSGRFTKTFNFSFSGTKK
jgi:hypothetical protein